MAKEFGSYLDAAVTGVGEPKTWEEANLLVQQALLALGKDRQAQYGHGNIAEFGEIGIVVRATDKLKRCWTMLHRGIKGEEEAIEDSFADLANYGVYGVMLQRRWWMLPSGSEER